MLAHAPTTVFDPVDPAVRSEAKSLAERLHGDSPVEVTVRSMLNAIALGTRVIVMREEHEVTPDGAAKLMGVSREFVNRLCEDGVLAFRRLPGSRDRRIRVEDVLKVDAEHKRRRAGNDAIRAALGM